MTTQWAGLILVPLIGTLARESFMVNHLES